MNAIFFGGSDGGTDESTDGDKAVSDDMGDAIAASIPIRNALSFGLYDKEELLKLLDELNKRKSEIMVGLHYKVIVSAIFYISYCAM